MTTKAVGLLAGWKVREAEHCVVLKVKIIENEHGVDDKDLARAMLAISDRQLCSLIRDLSRTAVARNLEIWPRGSSGRPPSGMDRLLGRLLGRRPSRKVAKKPAILLLPHLAAIDKAA